MISVIMILAIIVILKVFFIPKILQKNQTLLEIIILVALMTMDFVRKIATTQDAAWLIAPGIKSMFHLCHKP